MFKRRRTVKKRRPTKASYRRSKSVKKNRIRIRIYRKQRGGVDDDNQCQICYEKDICTACVFACQTIQHKFCTDCTTALIGIPGQDCPMCRSSMVRDAAREFLFPTPPPLIIPAITCGRLLRAARDVSCPFLSIRTPLFLLTGLFSSTIAISENLPLRLLGIVGATASSLMAISRRSQEVAESTAMIASLTPYPYPYQNGGEDPDLYICCMYQSGKELKQLYFKPKDFLKKDETEMLNTFKEKDKNITKDTVITTVLYLKPFKITPSKITPLQSTPLKDSIYDALKNEVSKFSFDSPENKKTVFKPVTI